jgi:hypothetical protein
MLPGGRGSPGSTTLGVAPVSGDGTAVLVANAPRDGGHVRPVPPVPVSRSACTARPWLGLVSGSEPYIEV